MSIEDIQEDKLDQDLIDQANMAVQLQRYLFDKLTSIYDSHTRDKVAATLAAAIIHRNI